MQPSYAATIGVALVSGLLGGITAWVLGNTLATDPAPTPAPVRPAAGAPAAERLAFLEGQIERLTAEVATLRAVAHRQPLAPELDARTGRPSPPGITPSEMSPRRYLELYARSFTNDPQGSKYFQLAVDAWALELVADISLLVRDPAQPDALRLQLLGILGTERFRGDTAAGGALLAGIRTGPGNVAAAAATGLQRIGTSADVAALESLFGSVDSVARNAVIQAIGKLAGPDASAVFLRLLHTAPTSIARVGILQQFANTNPEVTLQILREASTMELVERRTAALRLRTLRGPRFEGFAAEWLRNEPDKTVRQILTQAQREMATIPNHHPLQATGAPNADPNKDDPKAWAAATADGGEEWLEVAFARPMPAHSIRIHEVCVAGAVTAMETIDTRGTRRTVWRGDDPTATPGVFAVPMTPTTYSVRGVRILLDTRRRSGWNEVDTVQLVGASGSQWASGAVASSYFGHTRGEAGRFRPRIR